ncbi:MAG: hypothetical protein AVDCRST_MAG44-1112 [uncultured Sphingomonas sp.]|uniref:Uncharacterized protein n=1 Tax=uncultured Sphingomonas sp. TaxID=158754 RepID=A0A6J4SVZ1_9SPHN|nr:MAG: hypothetical protein AVDCRST_MAG44-1112 [uncultured Sphingomonas sp.]
MSWRFELDAYLQGGVVGFRRSDPFVDGGMTMTRPSTSNSRRTLASGARPSALCSGWTRALASA